MSKILIIEDDIDLRRMLTRLLERENFTVLEANNGLEANVIFDQAVPALVITDIIMPDQDGIGTINFIRKNFPGTKIFPRNNGPSVSAAISTSWVPGWPLSPQK